LRFHYDPEADSLYIDLADRASTESTEVAEGVVLDFDAAGRLVGIDIDHASQVVDLSKLEAEGLPRGRVMRHLEREVWSKVPSDLLGRGLTEEEQEELLGYGPDGV